MLPMRCEMALQQLHFILYTLVFHTVYSIFCTLYSILYIVFTLYFRTLGRHAADAVRDRTGATARRHWPRSRFHLQVASTNQ